MMAAKSFAEAAGWDLAFKRLLPIVVAIMAKSGHIVQVCWIACLFQGMVNLQVN
jgi:hypothetical protein